MLRPRARDPEPVELVRDRPRAHALEHGHVEDALDVRHGFRIAEHEPAVLLAAGVRPLLDPVAVGDRAAVVVAALGVLGHALHRLGREVHRVELVDDLDHALVQEPLRRGGVEVLGDALDHRSVLPKHALEEDGLLLVAAEPVQLVHEDGVHLVLLAVPDHLAETWALVGGRVGGFALVLEVGDDGPVGVIVGPAREQLLLGGDGDVLLGLLVGGDAAVENGGGHDEDSRWGLRAEGVARPVCKRDAIDRPVSSLPPQIAEDRDFPDHFDLDFAQKRENHRCVSWLQPLHASRRALHTPN